MKRLSTLLLAMVATAASAAIYPSSDWFGTNVQKQTTAAGVRAALGITSTGGSATNVYFTSGQSTTPRTVSGSNTFDVTGTLTNYTRNYSAGISNNAADSVNVVFQSANRLVFNDPTGGEQAHYVWGRAGTSLGSQDSFWWNPDLNFSWLSFLSHPFMGVGFNDDNVLIEWNYDESNAITNHIYGTNTSITIDGRYRGAGLSLTSTETNSSLTGGVLAADANGRRKIAALSGLAWDGTTLTASGDGSGLTNVPSKWFDSISAMTNSTPVSNLVVHVWSYFGTNWEGGGLFAWENSSATADLGRVFVGTSGRWRRVDTGYPTNYVFMEHFGVVPNATIDQYAGAQAAINATPTSEGKLILPSYNFAVGTTLTWTNRRGCYFGTLTAGYVETPGYRVYPNPTCVIHWRGANGGTNLVAYDVGHNTFRGFGLDTRIGLNNGDQYTNAAGLLMDVDMNSTHTTTTTANVFDGLYFRERHTNSALVGLRIASYNWQNCEFFQFANCSWQGGGANIPEYWISVTNIGASKAIQLGGNGGGQNSFNHQMRNCGFNIWQYFIHSSGGQWDITGNYGTAAGAAAYYLNCDGPCYIRGTRDEGDHQFVVSPSTHPVTLSANQIAMTTGMSVANVCPVDVQNLIAFGNKFQHEATIPSITNSFNSTGWYLGSQNSFCNTNDALIASWRFNSAFNSHGDFGTLKANNNIQSGPWKVPSATQETNVVYQNFTDGTASTMALTMMPSNGVFGVGSYLNNVHFGVYNPDLNKTSMQFGDSVINPRFKLLPSSSGLITELQLFGSNSVWMELYSGTGSSATRLDFVGSSAVNKIHARTGSLKITGTNDTDLLTFGTDYKIKFPYNTNVEFVGPIHGNILRATNHVTWFTNNSFTSLDPTPLRYGQVSLVNSNGVMWQVTATTSGTLAWAGTNSIPTTASQVVGKFTGTPTGSLFLRDDGTLAAPSVGGAAWGAISGTLSSQTDLQTALDGKATIASPNQFTKTNAFDALRATNMAQGVSSALVGWVADTKLFTTGSVVVAGSQISLSGTDGALLYNNAGGVDFADWSVFNSQGGTLTTNSANLSGLTKGNGARGVTNADWSDVQALTSNAILTNNHSASVVFGNTITGNGSGLTNLQFAPTAITLGDTNAAMRSNMVSTLIVSTNVLFTNWPAMAVAGYWGRTILTNNQPNNELIYVPTNMMPRNLTNSVGCYVVLDNTGTNWACTLTNLRTAELVWSAWGGNVNSMHAYFRHW